MDISGCTALVTGANRGLGRHFATDLLKRGAKVYAGARNPGSVDVDGARREMETNYFGIAAGAYEVLADDTTRGVQAGLAKGVAALYPQLAK